jgi:hypothetical protein
MDEPLPLFISHPEMGTQTHLVLEETIGSHLGATETASPTFRGADEPAADPASTDVGVDVPAFHVSDRPCVAAFRLWPDGRLDEPGKASPRTRGNERHRPLFLEVLVDFLAVLLRRAIGPEDSPHAHPLVSIARHGATDADRRPVRFGHRETRWTTR